MPEGLTTTETAARLAKDGRNELPKPNEHKLKKWLGRFFAPIPLMLIAAAVFSFILGKNFDGWFILVLFLVNLGITLWHEWKAESTLAALEDRVTAEIKTRRDGKWQPVSSKELVMGDVIELVAGSVVPADALILTATAVSANESALTGESLPVEKGPNDTLFTGTFIASGLVTARVTATGGRTKFGHTVALDVGEREPSLLEQDILRISRFLSLISIAMALVVSVVLLWGGQNWLEVIRFDLTLLIAGIPVALPAVMSLIISIGTLQLSKGSAIVRRLSALEDLSNVDLLLSDKTGTLTKNDITVGETKLFGNVDEVTVAAYAAATATEADHHALERAVVRYAAGLGAITYEVLEAIPGDSTRKRSTVLIKVSDEYLRVTLGAPQVVAGLTKSDAATLRTYTDAVDEAARRGWRSLGLAIHRGATPVKATEAEMELVALLFLSDELRDDARAVIDFLGENGVGVKMLTGDNLAVSREVAKALDIHGKVVSSKEQNLEDVSPRIFADIGVFSEIYPEDKQRLVALAKRDHIVAVTGDGINDLPALRTANVGIAVSNAVDALKGSADIVLTTDGIGVIRDAVIESRKIFARIYSYSVYRISESFRLIVAVAVFGLWLSQPLLTPVQLILLALLNDLPIITLAFNRVAVPHKPSTINVAERMQISLLYGSIGIINGVLFYLLLHHFMQLPWDMIQTLFFLKMTVSGHMLIYVAHTKERWYKFLPSWPVIVATTSTQVMATLVVFLGFLMTPIPWKVIVMVWVWSFFWMQISEIMKDLRQWLEARNTKRHQTLIH